MLNSDVGVQHTQSASAQDARRVGWIVALVLLSAALFLSITYVGLTIYASGVH
jgi:hypothetical protein